MFIIKYSIIISLSFVFRCARLTQGKNVNLLAACNLVHLEMNGEL